MRKIFGRIPPVGNPITVKTSDEIPEFPGSLKTYFLNSGTAALAAGLQIAQAHCKVKTPEVIIPAYCCPDLLSAILYNNMRPVLVDFIPDRPYMDLSGIESALNENTAAVIAVNFLGIPERFKEIKALLKNRPTLLIEDSAQWFPESDAAHSQHTGDIVVYSFGRGKPVCILSGGALNLLNSKLLPYIPSNFLPEVVQTKNRPLNHYAHKAKYAAYNLFISTSAYWLIELAPFLKVGETRYSVLDKNEAIDPVALRYLGANIRAYQKRIPNSQNNWRHSLSDISASHVQSLCNNCETYEQQRLLRLPLLFQDADSRTHFLKITQKNGLGTSGLYQHCLPKIADVPPKILANFPMPNAINFSSRLVTLPMYTSIDDDYIARTLASIT